MSELKTVHDRYSEAEIAAYHQAGSWLSTSFMAMIAEQAERRPQAPFLIDSAGTLSYAEFHDTALRLAVGLSRAGVTRGDRVAVQLPNWHEFPVIAAALSRLGAVVVPIMPIYRDDEVGYVLQHSGATLAITCGDFKGFDHAAMFRALQPQCPDLRAVHVARGTEADSLSHLVVAGDLTELAAELGPDSSPDDGFLIVYTSGTTSRPKGCFHTFNTVRASALAIGQSLDFTAEDVQFGPSPITHSTGLVTSVLLPALYGAASYLMEAWDPVAALDLIAEHRCTGAVTATPFLQMLMGAHEAQTQAGQPRDLSSLRFWVCAGSPIPSAVVERAREVFPQTSILALYGRSENFLTTMCTLSDDPQRSATSDGRALAGAQVALVDGTGAPVGPGEEGDIAYRGPSHMIEYFRNDAETAALFTPEGFSRSGDLGRMDADGYVRVTGRLKDIVIRGGMNISARELEEHLTAHPEIASVAVVGMPDERLGEKVCVYLVPAENSGHWDLAAVTDLLRGHGVATQKLPERLEVVTSLPMTATGKIQKHVLRADVAQKLASAEAR